MSRHEYRCDVTVSLPEHVVAEVADQLDELEDPDRGDVRDRLYDRVELRADFQTAENQPVADVVLE